MNLKERATIIHYHRHRIDTFGDGTIGALGWKAEESQTLRFEVIADAMELSRRSVLDVGCGHGDLRAFLGDRYDDFSYIGLEHVPEFVHAARERYGAMARTWFHECDVGAVNLPGVHYVVASGTLNYRCEDDDFHRHMIRRMFDAAEVTLIFNFLVAKRFPDHPLLRAHDPDELVAFCTELSPRVDVIDGYLEHDVTICVHQS